MTSFAEPEEDGMSYFLLSFSISDAVFIADVFRAISDAIEIISDGKHDLIRAHERIKMFYDWTQVAERTEVVHDTVVKSRQTEFWERRRGSFGRPAPSILLMLSNRMMGFFMFLEWWFPRDDMDIVVRHWDRDRFAQVGVPVCGSARIRLSVSLLVRQSGPSSCYFIALSFISLIMGAQLDAILHLVRSHPCRCYDPVQHWYVSRLSFVPSRTNA